MDKNVKYTSCPKCGCYYLVDIHYERDDIERIIVVVECQDCAFAWIEVWNFGISIFEHINSKLETNNNENCQQ